MSDRGERQLPDDLLRVAERLREERPSLDGLGLDRAKTRARRQATARRTPARNRKGALLKSRIAITMILALGILMSLSGATLAVSGLGDSSGDAAGVQYFNDPGDDSSTSSRSLGDPGDPSDPGDVEAASQESSGDGELAFTGFAAIPVLIGGIALLGSGLVLRRRSERDER
jgi:uncharacterized iron-regulated membrane protein